MASLNFASSIASRSPTKSPAKFAFFLQHVSECEDQNRYFSLMPRDFSLVNPNTGTTPIFRTKRDAELTVAIYTRLPVLVDRSSGREVKSWPVKYTRMFDMANNIDLFRDQKDLEEKENAYPVGGNRYRNAEGDWAPLYEGKMVQAFDHRASDIIINKEKTYRPGQQSPVATLEKLDPNRSPTPRYYVKDEKDDTPRWRGIGHWAIAFKDFTAATNARTMIAAVIPRVGSGNTLPLLLLDDGIDIPASTAALIVANLNAIPFDFVARQKVPEIHLAWYVLEQLPVVPLASYATVYFGSKTADTIIREIVLELTYTAHDMATFARDMGHVDENGDVLPPFVWDENHRLRLRAKLDAVFFHSVRNRRPR